MRLHYKSIYIDNFSLKKVKTILSSNIKTRQKTILISINASNVRLFSQAELWNKLTNNPSVILHPDGMSIVILVKLILNKKCERINGTDVTQDLLSSGHRVFAITPNDKTGHLLLTKYKNVQGYYTPPDNKSWYLKKNTDLIKKINLSQADIVLIGTGPLSKEVWTLNNYKSINSTIFAATGSSLELLTGQRQRAPLFFQKLCLEWVWRVFQEPTRLLPRYTKDFFYLLKLLI